VIAVRRFRALPWRSIVRRELPQIARIVLVATVAWQVCVLLGAVQPPLFAVLVPLVSLKDDPFSAFNLSVARLVGVVAGLLIAVGVLQVLHPSTFAIAVVLALALLVGVVLRIGNVLNNQVAVSALLVFSSTDAADYAVTRLWETGVGTAATLLLAPFLFPADPLAAARNELAGVTERLIAAVRSSTAVVGAGRVDDPEQKAVLLGVVDDLAGATATLQRLGTQIGTARTSARWAVLRRSAMHAAAELEPSRRLALRLTRHVEAFVEEATWFSGHPDFVRDATLRSERLDDLVRPLESCLSAALSGHPFADDLARARTAIADFRADDHSRVASVLRRPLHRMVEDLETFAAGAGHPG